jgi:hypothetical protein
MSEPTHKLDDLIREALAEDEAHALDAFEDPSAVEMLTEVFRGRNRLFAVLGVVINLVLFVIGVGAALAFANAQDLRAMGLYGGTAALCFGTVLAIKVWYWLEMMRLALTREMKRVELQVAHLDRRMRGQEGR